MSAKIGVRRVYDGPDSGDGRRVLVDRLWPRGFSKEKAAIDLWLREIAPSEDLRKWFGHDPSKWTEFLARYHQELRGNPEAVGKLEAMAKAGPVTLLFAASDLDHNNAVALRSFLIDRLGSSGGKAS